jgi:hypothetical protein
MVCLHVRDFKSYHRRPRMLDVLSASGCIAIRRWVSFDGTSAAELKAIAAATARRCALPDASSSFCCSRRKLLRHSVDL